MNDGAILKLRPTLEGIVDKADAAAPVGKTGLTRRNIVVAVVTVLAVVVAVVAVRALWLPRENSETRVISFYPIELSDPGVLLSKVFGGSGEDVFTAVAVTGDERFVVVGYTDSADGDFAATGGGCDAVVAMVDSKGKLAWSKTVGGSGNDVFHSVTIGADGAIYAVGETHSDDGDLASRGGADALVVKLTHSGAAVWAKTFGGTGDDHFTDVVATDDGVVVTGYTDSVDGDFRTTHFGKDALLAGISSDGALLWTKCLGGSGDDFFDAATLGLDGTIVVVGRTSSPDGDFPDPHDGANALIAAFSQDGQLAWSYTFGGSGDDEFSAVATTGEGKFFVAGSTSSMDGDLPYALTTMRSVGIYGVLTSYKHETRFGARMEGQNDNEYAAAAVTEGGKAAAVGTFPVLDGRGRWPCGFVYLSDEAHPDKGAIMAGYPGGEWNAVAAMSDERLVVVGHTMPRAANFPAKHGENDALLLVLQL